jgi:hypothetical protein
MKQETLEKFAEKLYPVNNTGSMFMANRDELNNSLKQEGFIEGAKWQAERMYSEEDIIGFAEFIAKYPDKNRNHTGQMLHAKSKYDGAERTIDLLQVWFEHFKNK